MPHQNPSELPSTPTKENLKSWWKQFTAKKGKREDEGKENDHQGVFGVSLAEGIHYASVPICMTAADGQQYVYGYIPIIVAKCGMLSGSAKRIKELQIKFDTPPSYGKTLDWTGYSVHDAANIFRRYLNQLPDPVIPLQWYDAFRSVHYPTTRVINYQKLIANLPKENQHLLLYILDLLAVFSSKSSENLMPSSNLASIFQPGVLSHPSHNMSPEQYKLSQEVLGFLIEHQNYFLPTSNITTAGNNNASSSTNDRDNSQQNLKEPFDLNNPPVKRISLRRQSLSHEPFALDTTLPSPSSEIQPSESTGLVRSRTLPSKRPKYSENRNSNSEKFIPVPVAILLQLDDFEVTILSKQTHKGFKNIDLDFIIFHDTASRHLIGGDVFMEVSPLKLSEEEHCDMFIYPNTRSFHRSEKEYELRLNCATAGLKTRPDLSWCGNLKFRI
nr:11382_t:CDS:2 [Entrophospora candida]